MSQVDFSKKKDGTGSAPAAVETVNQPVTTPAGDTLQCPTTSCGVPAKRTDNDLGLSGHVPDFSEVIIPRINLVANTGKLKDQFDPGCFVYQQQLVLYTPAKVRGGEVITTATAPLKVTIIDFQKTRFVEKKTVQDGIRGLLFNTEEEVIKAGGTTDYKEWEAKKDSGMKRFEYLATALTLIERPEQVKDDGTVFVYEIDGRKYALALYGMKGSAYTVAKKALFTPRKFGYLQGGYPTFSHLFTTETKERNGNTYWCPVIRPGERSSAAMIDFVKSIVSMPSVAVDDSGE